MARFKISRKDLDRIRERIRELSENSPKEPPRLANGLTIAEDFEERQKARKAITQEMLHRRMTI